MIKMSHNLFFLFATQIISEGNKWLCMGLSPIRVGDNKKNKGIFGHLIDTSVLYIKTHFLLTLWDKHISHNYFLVKNYEY